VASLWFYKSGLGNPRNVLFLEDQELIVLHDAFSVVCDLLKDGLVGLALEDDVFLH
jgi:hypothetical protein